MGFFLYAGVIALVVPKLNGLNICISSHNPRSYIYIFQFHFLGKFHVEIMNNNFPELPGITEQSALTVTPDVF